MTIYICFTPSISGFGFGISDCFHHSVSMLSVAQGTFCTASILGAESPGCHRPDRVPGSDRKRSCDTRGGADCVDQRSRGSHRVSGWTGVFVFLLVTLSC